MTLRNRRIAVLGAGIMGSSLALMFARRGASVDLIDREAQPMACASRWNEGKIHLGYIYGADPSLQTARRIIPGGLCFGQLLTGLIGTDITANVTPADDTLLVHRNSIVTAADLAAIYGQVSAILRDHPDAGHYLVDVSQAQAVELTPRQLAKVADTENIIAGFLVPERSINTQWVADRLVEALDAETGITQRLGVTVVSAQAETAIDGRWKIIGSPIFDETYDIVVNALWNGKLSIDRTAGLAAVENWSNRYRLSVFAQTSRDVHTSSAIVALGPFGDVKNYNNRDFYLSWYPAGLVTDTSDLMPDTPILTPQSKADVLGQIREKLVAVMPPIAEIFAHLKQARVEGGFVFAQGKGQLDNPASSLHRRDLFGIQRRGTYFSVDTGKYSTSLKLAENLVQMIEGRL